MPRTTYYKYQVSLTLGVVALVLAAARWAEGFNHLEAALGAVLFSSLTTALAYTYTSAALKRTPASFVTTVLSVVSLKLLGNLMFIGVCIWLLPRPLYSLVGAFFFAYLVFTAFEIHSLLSNLRAESDSPAAPLN